MNINQLAEVTYKVQWIVFGLAGLAILFAVFKSLRADLSKGSERDKSTRLNLSERKN